MPKKQSTINNQPLAIMRHSCAHLLAEAVMELFPDVKLGIGPAIEDGFYYEFLFKKSISEKELSTIEKKMEELKKQNLKFGKKEVSLADAQKIFKNQPFKLELIAGLKKEEKAEKAGIYQLGDFVDLCKGPHVSDTSKIGPFKLLSIAGAYWKGDEKNPMLTRIYCTCFKTKKELAEYLKLVEEARKRDHRKLGKELDLYSISSLVGSGLILWHPKLSITRNIVEQFWKEEHIKRGYKLVYTPHIANMDMFVKTRHYTKYIDFMFPVMLHQYIEGESKADYTMDEQLKPMNCPSHIEIFKYRPRSYRELPLRMAELGTVYRYERAGVLHGLTRVRGFTQDDSHVFCTPQQVIKEVRNILILTRYMYEDIFGFKDYKAYLATKPEKYLGTAQMWGSAQDSLKKAMEAEKIDYKIDEGQGVFYGPKIDSKIKDSLGREWQLGTIQVDFNLPTYSKTTKAEIEEFWALKTFKDRFKTKDKLAKYLKKMGRGLDVKYIDKDGKEKQVVMIHRTILGSMERFFGILIEHYGGAFPLWLAPVQVVVIPITDKQIEYGQKIKKGLEEKNIRVELDDRSKTTSFKIRDAQLQKIPYMLVVGVREVKEKKVAVRLRSGEDLGPVNVESFLVEIKKEIEEKKI